MPLALTDLLSPDAPVQGELRVSVPIQSWPRLAAAVLEPEGAVSVDVKVAPLPGVGGSAVTTVVGRLSACVPLRCQRCLETVRVEMEQELNLAVTAESGEQAVPDQMEAWPLLTGPVSLGELLEDELLLALPLVPMHADPADCGELLAKLDSLRGNDGPIGSENPFAALKNLKR